MRTDTRVVAGVDLVHRAEVLIEYPYSYNTSCRELPQVENIGWKAEGRRRLTRVLFDKSLLEHMVAEGWRRVGGGCKEFILVFGWNLEIGCLCAKRALDFSRPLPIWPCSQVMLINSL